MKEREEWEREKQGTRKDIYKRRGASTGDDTLGGPWAGQFQASKI